MNNKAINKDKILAFNKMLEQINCRADVIKNIDRLYKFASYQVNQKGVYSPINMLRNSIRINAPALHNAFTLFVLSYCKVNLDSITEYLKYDSTKNINCNPPHFLYWLEHNEEAKKTFPDIDIVELKKLKAISIDLKNVNSENRNSIWTISGGGGPGTGKRR